VASAKITTEILNDLLASHLIDPALLASNQFEAFFQARKLALCKLIGAAIGKPVSNVPEVEEPSAGPDDDLIAEMPLDSADPDFDEAA